jgi:catechol 2,3-dioxygenase-like lactoylglutathione lyase family enzyme
MIGRLEKTVFDCPDPRSLAEFYAAILGMRVLEDEPNWVVIGRQEHMRELAFQKVEPYVAPRWPDGRHPQQLHLDITVEDFGPAVDAVQALGAVRRLGAPETG